MPDDPKFPLTAAQLVANWCETLFYGIYLVTCAFAGRSLLLIGKGKDERWLRLHEIRWMMVLFSLGFFAILTFDAPIGLYHNYVAFILSKGPDGPLNEFLNLADWVNIARSTTQCVTMIMADFILIYRCWIVYGKRWLVVVPSIVLFFACIAVTARVVDLQVEPATNKNATLNNGSEFAWTIAFFTLTAAQNILSTSLLIFRIWSVDRDLEKYVGSANTFERRQPRHLRKIVIAIGESGAFYTLTVLISLVLAIVSSDGFYPMTDITLQSTGIVFNVILVRASAIRDRQFTTYNADQSTFHATPRPGISTIIASVGTDIEGSVTASGERGFKLSNKF